MVNEENLRKAKNIKELVGIQLEKVPISVRRRDGSYDFKFDAVRFQQKMPLLGERDFLVT